MYNYRNYADDNAKNYYALFKNCTNLISAPDLPATTLVSECYYEMFSGCTSLETAPELPATTLVYECYKYMFYECTSLQRSPVLSPVQVASNSLKLMFCGCTSLNKIIWLAKGNILSYSYSEGWVRRVASTGTFYKHKEATNIIKGENGCPSGWTVEDYEEQ